MIIDINTLLAWGAVYKKVGRNEVIFSEGAECSYYNQLVTGTVKWVNIDEEGKEYIQTIIERVNVSASFPFLMMGYTQPQLLLKKT